MNTLITAREFSNLFSEKGLSNKFPSESALLDDDGEHYIPTHYFVDYENGRSARLEGFDKLHEGDKVYIVYTANAGTAAVEIMIKLQESPVEFYWIESPIGQQAADKYLIALFAADAAVYATDCKYVVVSADKGFDPCVQLIELTFKASVKRKTVLQGAEPTPAKAPSQAKKAPVPANNRPNSSNKPPFDRFTNHRDLNVRAIGKIVELSGAEKHKVANYYLDALKSGKPGNKKHLAYCALQGVLGSKRGQELYHKYKYVFDQANINDAQPRLGGDGKSSNSKKGTGLFHKLFAKLFGWLKRFREGGAAKSLPVEPRQQGAYSQERERQYRKAREIVRNELNDLDVGTRIEIVNVLEDDYKESLNKVSPPSVSTLLHNAFCKVMGVEKGQAYYARNKDKFKLY